MPALLSPAQLSELRPMMLATTAYFALYYAFMIFQSFSKIYLATTATRDDAGKKPSLAQIKYGPKRGLALMSDRTFLNMMEQSPALLTALWMYALAVDPSHAANLMWAYLPFRALYPVVFLAGVPVLFLSTAPNYAVIWYALYRVADAIVTR